MSQSFVHEGKFIPGLRHADGPAAGLAAPLPPLYGFVRTSKKPSALASMPVEGPRVGDQEFPILAYWHYGLGKAVAFTSDARSQKVGTQGWDKDWAASDIYLKFWEQVVGWTLRSVETGKLSMTTEAKDGRIKVTVDARDPVTKKPITNLRLEGAVTAPSAHANGGKPILLDFKQKNAGQYEAEFKADEAGSYFLNTTAKQTVEEMKDGQKVLAEKVVDGVRSGVTIPYSPEFSDLETNIAELKRIAEITGGNLYGETDVDLKKVVESNEVYRTAPVKDRSYQPFWFWLVLAAGLGLLVDVAIRRVAVEPSEAWGSLKDWWSSLRGRRVAAVETPFLDRLKSRKSAPGRRARPGQVHQAVRGRDAGWSAAARRGRRDRTAAAGQTEAYGFRTGGGRRRLRRPAHARKKKALDERDDKKE